MMADLAAGLDELFNEVEDLFEEDQPYAIPALPSKPSGSNTIDKTQPVSIRVTKAHATKDPATSSTHGTEMATPNSVAISVA